eukprot:4390193-Prymnesium_polylepis.1
MALATFCRSAMRVTPFCLRNVSSSMRPRSDCATRAPSVTSSCSRACRRCTAPASRSTSASERSTPAPESFGCRSSPGSGVVP